MIQYSSEEHRKRYIKVRSMMGGIIRDPYRAAVAYLIALDNVVYPHMEDIYDFKEDHIKPDGLHHDWQTGTSRKTTRLAFNLWNNFCTDGETYKDKQGYERDLPSYYFSPVEIFSAWEYAPYYWQAIKIRFEYDNYYRDLIE